MNWRWISRAVVLAIHDQQLAEHGGKAGVRDLGLLESALARSQNLAAYGGDEVDLAALAAAYAFGLAQNHPFIDGNKRVAAVVMELFLDEHGFVLDADDSELVLTMLRLADGSLPESELATWLRSQIKRKRRPR